MPGKPLGSQHNAQCSNYSGVHDTWEGSCRLGFRQNNPSAHDDGKVLVSFTWDEQQRVAPTAPNQGIAGDGLGEGLGDGAGLGEGAGEG